MYSPRAKDLSSPSPVEPAQAVDFWGSGQGVWTTEEVAPPRAHQGKVGGQSPPHFERACSDSLTLYMPLNNGTLLLWRPRLLPQIFLVVELHPPIPSGFLVTTGSRLSPGLLSPDPTFQHPAHLHLQTHLRLGCTGLWHGPPVEVSLCPACHRLVAVFSNSSSVPADSPANEGASPGTGPSRLLHLPPWGARSHSASCFFLSFFHSPWLCRDLCCPFSCPKSSSSVQHVL